MASGLHSVPTMFPSLSLVSGADAVCMGKHVQPIPASLHTINVLCIMKCTHFHRLSGVDYTKRSTPNKEWGGDNKCGVLLLGCRKMQLS